MKKTETEDTESKDTKSKDDKSKDNKAKDTKSKDSKSKDSKSKDAKSNAAKSDDEDKLDFNEILSNVRNFILNQFILFAMTSFLFSIGTFIGGLIIQTKIQKKLIPSMITYIPYILFTTFYLISGAVHLISALYGFFKTGWFLSLSIFLRLLAIITGLFSIYLNYSKKDNLIKKVEDIWFQDSYALIVSYYQDYFNCCGWNTTTATCSYTRCYDFINDQIDDIARMIGIASFVINTFQVGLCVDSILAVALQIESPKKSKKNKNANEDKMNKDKNKNKDKDKNKDKNKNKNKNAKLKDNQNLSTQELDENAQSVHFNLNSDSPLLNQSGQNNQTNKEGQNSSNTNLNSTRTDTNDSNLSLQDTSSNTQNTQNTIYEVQFDRSKNKKSKENKKSKKSTSDEMELELIADSSYK